MRNLRDWTNLRIAKKNESRIQFLSHFKMPESKNGGKRSMYHDNLEIQSVDSYSRSWPNSKYLWSGFMFNLKVNLRHLFVGFITLADFFFK